MPHASQGLITLLQRGDVTAARDRRCGGELFGPGRRLTVRQQVVDGGPIRTGGKGQEWGGGLNGGNAPGPCLQGGWTDK